MRRIVHSIAMLAAAAAALISCNKEVNPVEPAEKEYTYTFALSNTDTRAYLDLDDTITKWEEGDQLGVYAVTPSGTSYNRWGNITLLNPVVFQISSYYALTAGSSVYCYFPYDARNKEGEAQNPQKVNLSIPAEQNGKMNAMPMVSVPYSMTKAVNAQIDEPIADINMRNLGGVFQFNIFSSNAEYQTETIEKVEFNANAAIAGSFVYDITKEELSEISGLSETAIAIEDQNLAVAADKDNASKVLMVVAPGSHSGSLVVTTDVAIYTLNFSSAKQVERSHIKPLNVDLAKAISRQVLRSRRFVKISSLSEIDSDTDYLVVGHAYRSAEAGDYAMSNAFNTLSSTVKVLSGVSVVDKNGVILVGDNDPYVVRFESTGATNQYLIKSGNIYLRYAGSQTQIASTADRPVNGSGLWNISLATGDASTLGTFIIGDESTNNKRCLAFQSYNTNDANNVATLRFAAYSIANVKPAQTGDNDYSAVELYKFEDNRTTQTLSYSATAGSIDLNGDVRNLPILDASGAETTITYTSSEPAVATIDESTGVISAVAVGTTTITATAADDATHKAVSASFTLTVSNTSPAGGKLTYSFIIQTSDFNTTSYAANNGSHDFTAKCTTDASKTMTVACTSNQVMQSSSVMQWQKDKGYIFNTTDLGTIKSVTVKSSAGTFTTNYGTAEHPISGTTVGNGYFTISVGNATGKTESIIVTFEK